MSKLHVQQFDVVIVYEGMIAEGASDASYRGRTPFSRKGKYFKYNKSYEYFLTQCEKKGIKAAFASTKDITTHGMFKAVWLYTKKWERLHEVIDAKIVFDKFSHRKKFNSTYDAKLKNNVHGVKYFHNPLLREIFDDKLKTYTTFSEITIPTTKIDVRSKNTIAAGMKELRKRMRAHTSADDFEQSFVLKDQYGAGGEDVYKVDTTAELLYIGKQDTRTPYIVQPFITASGFTFKKQHGCMDLRVIICNGKITDCYVRIAREGEFRANASCGGEVVYINAKKIPREVVGITELINHMLPVQDGFYAIDFMKSSSGRLYFIEGNSTPGLIWFTTKDERQVKRFMRAVIDKLKVMVATT